jgi:hypothetical protein
LRNGSPSSNLIRSDAVPPEPFVSDGRIAVRFGREDRSSGHRGGADGEAEDAQPRLDGDDPRRELFVTNPLEE